jgi:hypothetical protein
MEEPAVAPKKKKSATPAQIGKELKQIYAADERDDGPQENTISRAARRRRWPGAIIAALILFALAGIAWAGILRFQDQTHYGNDVKVSIDGPAAPRGGEAGTWTIRYENDETLPLASAHLTLQLPPSFSVISSAPELIDPKSLSWKIGAVEPGGSGTITVKARVLDALDAPLAVQAVLTYRPANFNADFQKIGSWSSRIADSAIVAELTAPDESVPGDSADFKLTISRQTDLSSDAAVPDLKIRFDPDQLIVIKSATPDFSSSDQRTWMSAPPGDKPLVFSVNGSFAAGVSGDTRLHVEVGALDANNNFIILAPASAMTSVAPGDLSLTLIRNGSMADSTVGLGQALHVSVDYQNQSAKIINDAEISLTIAGTPSVSGADTVDWKTLSDLRGGKRSGNTITWTKKEIPDLGTIAAGAKGSIDLSFKAVNSVFTTVDSRYDIDLSARGLIGAIGGKKSGKTVSTPVMRTLINSDAQIAAAAKQTGGSSPPKAGEAATYRLVWVLTNSLHEISGIRLAAQLPVGTDFSGNGNVDAGNLQYDGTTRTISWTLNRLPTSIKSVSAEFTASVTPSSDEVGKTAPLLGETGFTATDQETGASLSSSAQPLDTADAIMETDEAGAVQP